MKPIRFLGDSRERVQEFPAKARYEIGAELLRVQLGREPKDWKPMSSIGEGVREIRVRDETGAYRVIYVTKIGEFIYVLHAFRKKTQQTTMRDLRLASARLRSI